MRPKRQSIRLKGMSVRSDATTEDENCQTYQEFNDSSSRTFSDDGNDGDDTSGGTTSLAAQGRVAPSWSTSSHTTPRMNTTTSRHRQEFE
jgi:hypothetical protein